MQFSHFREQLYPKLHEKACNYLWETSHELLLVYVLCIAHYYYCVSEVIALFIILHMYSLVIMCCSRVYVRVHKLT